MALYQGKRFSFRDHKHNVYLQWRGEAYKVAGMPIGLVNTSSEEQRADMLPAFLMWAALPNR